MLASFLGPRLRGDHHVNKAVMVSLMDMDLLLGTEQALMMQGAAENQLADVATLLKEHLYNTIQSI